MIALDLGLLHLLAPRVVDLVAALGNVLAASDDEGGTGWLLLAGPIGGFAIYMGLFRYYRNTDKSHSYERETVIESQPVAGQDAKVDEVRGTKRTSIQGNNVRDHRQRVQRVQ